MSNARHAAPRPQRYREPVRPQQQHVPARRVPGVPGLLLRAAALAAVPPVFRTARRLLSAVASLIARCPAVLLPGDGMALTAVTTAAVLTAAGGPAAAAGRAAPLRSPGFARTVSRDVRPQAAGREYAAQAGRARHSPALRVTPVARPEISPSPAHGAPAAPGSPGPGLPALLPSPLPSVTVSVPPLPLPSLPVPGPAPSCTDVAGIGICLP